MNADRLVISGLRVRGRHGVHDEERRAGQEFVVDATLTFDTSGAAATDDLTQTVDYSALTQQLADVVAGEPVALIETLAARLADVCLADERVQSAVVTVHKPHAPLAADLDDVCVTIERTRR